MNKIFLIVFSLVSFMATAQTGGGYNPTFSGSSIVVQDSAWSLLGNGNTNAGTNFLGTTDNVGLSFRTNNIVRQTITNTGNVGIGTASPVFKLSNTSSAILDGGPGLGLGTAVHGIGWSIAEAGYTVGIENTDMNAHSNGLTVRTASVDPLTSILSVGSANIRRMVVQGNGNVGIGTTAPTSNIHINGSEAGSITNITATTALNATHHKILVSNGATNITITLPDALTCLGREYVISRAAGSTGSITIQRTGTNIIQSLNGTTGATTSIGLHSATGGGLRHSFTAVNIGGIGVWVRL